MADGSLHFAGFYLSSLSFFLNRFHKGDVLITTATGVMSEEEGEKWGLVPTHAYAVLDIREYKVPSKTAMFPGASLKPARQGKGSY